MALIHLTREPRAPRSSTNPNLPPEDPAERKKALVEGDEMLQKGSVGRNHLWFCRYAIEACLNAQERDEAARHAEALEDYTRPEPFAMGQPLCAIGRVPGSSTRVSSFER